MRIENETWDLAKQRSLGTLQGGFSKVVGAKITASSTEKKKKLQNREYRERKQLLKGRPEWAWSWRGFVRSREGFFCCRRRGDRMHINC